MQTALIRTTAAVDIEALCSLDRFDQPRAAQLRQEPRPVYDWSLERPGAEHHIAPISETIPADLDPHLLHLADEWPQIRTIRLHSNADALSDLRTRCHLIIGLATCAAIAALCVVTAVSTSIRIPEIERQLAMQARI